MQIGPSTRALVTGASRGIGRALAERLAARGATVGLLARSEDELEALSHGLPGTHHPLAVDVTDREAMVAAVARFAEAVEGIDLLVANAGVANYGHFLHQDPAADDQMVAINVMGTLNTVRAALPGMVERRSGHVVIVSSGQGLRTFPWSAVYGGTKAFDRHFAEALRHELAGTGISLTTVYPGEIATSLHDHEKHSMPPWWRGGAKAIPAHHLADKIVKAVERDRRELFDPPIIRLLGIVHGLSPRAADEVLRRMRGPSAAPRKDP